MNIFFPHAFLQSSFREKLAANITTFSAHSLYSNIVHQIFMVTLPKSITLEKLLSLHLGG